MKLHVDLVASVPKDLERSEQNEDAWAMDETLTRFALSDGASESYDSRAWAHLLVKRYVTDSRFLPAWIDEAVEDYAQRTDGEALSWSQQAAYERGSFATLLGLQLAERGQAIEVFAIGDSLACHIRGGTLMSTFPYVAAEEFDARPALLSTLGSQNGFLMERGFFNRNAGATWAVQAGDIILLVTDAVGQWLLREKLSHPSSLQMLAAISSGTELSELVLRLRAQGRIRYDDSTVIRLIVDSD